MMRTSRRRLLAAGGAVALGGCLGGNGQTSTPANTNGPVADAPVPDDPSSLPYATMGNPDRPVVTYYGNWKCPYCAQFSTGFLGDIVSDYVEPGDIALRFRALAYIQGEPFLGSDAPRAARAGLAVWNVDPDTYWPFHEYVFANQPPERESWATTDKLVSFAKQAGVDDVEQVRTALDNGRYESAVRESTQAAANAGVSGTPMLVIDGETVNPLGKPERTRSLIEALGE